MNVLVVSRMWPRPSAPHSGAFVRDEVDQHVQSGLKVTVLHAWGGAFALPYTSLALRIRRCVLKGNYDVLHAHYGTAGFCAVLQDHVPTVVTLHGSDLQGKRNLKNGVTIGGKVEQRLTRYAAAKAQACIVVSKEMQSMLPEVRTHLIPCGVNHKKFLFRERGEARARLGISSDSKARVLFAGDPSNPVKNYALAAEAVNRLEASGIAIELVPLVGVPHGEVPLWMNASDCLVLTSYSEGSPMVVKEAIACGLPVVSVDVGDVQAYIGPDTGLIVERTAQSVSEGIAKLLFEGRCGRPEQSLSGVPHIEHSAEQVRNVYAKVCATSKAIR